MTPYEQSVRLMVVESLQNWIELKVVEDTTEYEKAKELLELMSNNKKHSDIQA